jgi:sugar O-acyltransferase (sialic acid O-acetyltransferase NeuD family)
MPDKLLIMGTGPFASTVATLAIETGLFDVSGFIEESPTKLEHIINLPVLSLTEAKDFIATHRLVCAQGSTGRSYFIRRAQDTGFDFATIVHPNAYVSSTATIGTGCIVSPGCVVSPYAKMGDFATLTESCTLSHHAQVGSYSTVGCGAMIAGEVHIGQSCWIGMSASITEQTRVGNHCFIGAGSVISSNIEDGQRIISSARVKTVRQ